MTRATASTVQINKSKDNIFYTAMAVAMGTTVFLGFAPTPFLKTFNDSPTLPALLHAHGIAFPAGYLLFFTRNVLISKRRLDLHRRLGLAGFCLAILMVGLGVTAAVQAIRTHHAPPGLDPRSFLVMPFFGITVFTVLVTVGYFAQAPRDPKEADAACQHRHARRSLCASSSRGCPSGSP